MRYFFDTELGSGLEVYNETSEELIKEIFGVTLDATDEESIEYVVSVLEKDDEIF